MTFALDQPVARDPASPRRAVHVGILHAARDPRVYGRECRALAEAGWDVHLLTPPDPAEPPPEAPVTWHALERPRSLAGVAPALWRALRRTVALRPDVCHVHEAITIPVGLAMKALGARFVYDVHEDAPRQAMVVGRNKGSHLYGHLLRTVYGSLEMAARLAADAFVCATPSIARRFPTNRTVRVRNVPKLDDVSAASSSRPMADRPPHLVYAGGISKARGLAQMLSAVDRLTGHPEARLRLAGRFAPATLEAEAERMPGWSRTDFLGWLSRERLADETCRARAGLVLFLPGPNHTDALPNKLFEYMAAGLPVVASNFPRWRRLIEGERAGLCVDPTNPERIAAAVAYLLDHPAEAEAMGRRGRRAVEARYSWPREAERLLEAYDRLLP